MGDWTPQEWAQEMQRRTSVAHEAAEVTTRRANVWVRRHVRHAKNKEQVEDLKKKARNAMITDFASQVAKGFK